MLRAILAISLVIITGCARQQQPIISNSPYSLGNTSQPLIPPAKNSTTSSNINKTLDISVIPKKYANFRGIVTITPQQRTIRLCRNTHIFNLQADNHLLEQVKRLQQTNAYIEFEGQITQSLNPKLQRPIITVEQLHFLAKQNNNACQQVVSTTDFDIIGSEPNWRGYGKDNQFTFIIKDLKSNWTIKKSVMTKGLRAFIETENNQDEQLNISFSGNGCIDNNDNYWQYNSTLYVKDKQITACGKYPSQQGNAQDWLGQYNYKNSNVTIELALLANNQAKVKYRYSNGKELHESGYWHVYGTSGLKLLLTEHQGNKANIEFHFRRDGVRLQANQQWRDNQKYSFNGAILTLDRMTDEIVTTAFTTTLSPSPIREFQAQSIPSPTISTPTINTALKRYFTMHKTSTEHSKYWFSEYDLNGNGRKDLLVMLDWCEGEGCVLLVFENGLNRYKFISRITQVQTPLQISKTQQHRWQSLLIKDKQQWLQLDFDGISYPSSAKAKQLAAETNFTLVKLFTTALTQSNAISIE
ncbi:hypothetical protein [Moritella sp. Urea-trap-13]|uniref:hypothetical protein n=1 Tax=Moritella sp. Urea-trap-13 TaxID=2058327 RepID=UPI000C31F63F|nr:hypothetical protein [Moritella sp. Urea-trap-13]PKH09138.1 hypothetical protein CXF93_02260 [Moritella sp. Urea-trap-13]